MLISIFEVSLQKIDPCAVRRQRKKPKRKGSQGRKQSWYACVRKWGIIQKLPFFVGKTIRDSFKADKPTTPKQESWHRTTQTKVLEHQLWQMQKVQSWVIGIPYEIHHWVKPVECWARLFWDTKWSKMADGWESSHVPSSKNDPLDHC